MKRTNRLRALMLTLCLLAAALLPMNGMQGFAMPVAQAEENLQLLRISLLAQPDSLVEPGEVTLILGIENTSDVLAENVYLSSSDGLLSEPVGQIEAGQTISLNRPHSVSQAELDAGAITYIISHDDPNEAGHKVNYTVQTPIEQSELNPEVEVDFMPIPINNDPVYNDVLYAGPSTYWVVNKESEVKEEAKEFLNWLVSSERGRHYLSEEFAFVCGLTSIPVADEFVGPLGVATANAVANDKALGLEWSKYPDGMTVEFGTWIQKYIADQCTKEEMLEGFTNSWLSLAE